MFGFVAVLGNYSITLVQEISRDIRCVGDSAIEGVVDIKLTLAASEFPQVVSRNEERAVEKSASAVKRGHIGQSDADIAVQSCTAPPFEKVCA